jgi:hypothetical protein
MVSIWWVVSAFLMGGFAGLLAVSLIGMAAREGRHAVKLEKSLGRVGLGTVELDEGWIEQRAAGRKHSNRNYVVHAHAR